MARGNLIQGQGSGKVGDVVFMVRQGQQVSRVYTESGARSGKQASEASRIQRVKFGSASNQWLLFRYVSTRMYRRGRSSRQSDYNYFVKRNQPLFPYLTKEENASGVHVVQPGVFSEGNLGRIELAQYYNPTFTQYQPTLKLSDANVNVPSDMFWSSGVRSFKETMAAAYPGARKLTYLFGITNELTISEGAASFSSQTVVHETVVIDLYNEVTPLENQKKVSELFAAQVKNATLKAMFNSLTTDFAKGNDVFTIIPAAETDVPFLGKLAVLLFASDDNVDDCYTTTLLEDGVNPTAGAYADWASYRTAASLRVACDSYGYQTGVMRDSIASVGNDISAQVSAYAARLAMIDEKASVAYLKSVGDVSQVQAKAVRKSAEEK